jgi:hypothetical protein
MKIAFFIGLSSEGLGGKNSRIMGDWANDFFNQSLIEYS